MSKTENLFLVLCYSPDKPELMGRVGEVTRAVMCTSKDGRSHPCYEVKYKQDPDKEEERYIFPTISVYQWPGDDQYFLISETAVKEGKIPSL